MPGHPRWSPCSPDRRPPASPRRRSSSSGSGGGSACGTAPTSPGAASASAPAGRMAGWTFGMLLLTTLAGIVQTQVLGTASGQNASVAAVDYAWLIFMLPHSVITVSIATAYFTRMSEHAAGDDLGRVRDDVSSAIRGITLIINLAAAVLLVIAYPFAAVFETGELRRHRRARQRRHRVHARARAVLGAVRRAAHVLRARRHPHAVPLHALPGRWSSSPARSPASPCRRTSWRPASRSSPPSRASPSSHRRRLAPAPTPRHTLDGARIARGFGRSFARARAPAGRRASGCSCCSAAPSRAGSRFRASSASVVSMAVIGVGHGRPVLRRPLAAALARAARVRRAGRCGGCGAIERHPRRGIRHTRAHRDRAPEYPTPRLC